MNEWADVINGTTDGISKLFTGEALSEDELQHIKDFLTGYCALPDMDDNEKENIRNATVEDIHQVIKDAYVKTVRRSFTVRYGITIDYQLGGI